MREMPSPSEFPYSYSKLESESDDCETDERKLEVYIYDSEYEKIKNWVLQYRNIETGGDLFGLWVDSHTAVVQFAIGPGKNCRRRKTSFFQDLQYLESAGDYLTKKHGLCNLGQWHSHHQLSLDKPSAGDENTVWSHMPKLGLTRYIVCIANISKGSLKEYQARVNCFLFELNDRRTQLPVLQGKFCRLPNASPLNEHAEVTHVIAGGAEKSVDRDACPEEDDDSSKESCWDGFKKDVCPPTRNTLIFLVILAIIIIALAVYFTVKRWSGQL